MAQVETYGRYLLNKTLPPQYRIKKEISKGELKTKMNELARSDPTAYVRSITNLKRQGDELATLEGLSVGLEDITPQYKKRERLLAPLKKSFRTATSDKRRRQIAEEAQSRLLKDVLTHPGSLTLQVKSGARGSPTQYANMVSGLGYARDAKGSVYPWLIEKSYAEGLSPADYYATSNQSITDVIKTYTSVSEPGELSKKLVAGMSDMVITEDDCGTQNGVLLEATSPYVIDRFLAKSTGGARRNTLVSPTNQSRIAKSAKKILVRSPMTCEAADGICQKCQGLDEKGNLHGKGINVGVRSAQAMSEPLVQFALNAKHGGRTLESDKNQVHGIQGFRQIIETPKLFVNKATLSSQDGKVTGIETAPQGGRYVYVDKKQHYVSPGLRLKVKKGQTLERGDILSEGIPKPDEVVRHKGLSSGRLYMVNTLHDLYQGQGKDLDKRHFELLAKSSMNHVRIMEDPTNTFIKGDVVGYNTLRKELGSKVKQLPLREALGETLGKEYYQYSVGTRVTPNVVKGLRKEGIKEVLIAPRAPQVEFVMKSATNVPKMHKDWIARMAHQGLKPAVLQAAHTGEYSDLHGTHPVPAYAYGVEFGQGESGRY
jgi:DNA-directed RNA polymerase subunit beta'